MNGKKTLHFGIKHRFLETFLLDEDGNILVVSLILNIKTFSLHCRYNIQLNFIRSEVALKIIDNSKREASYSGIHIRQTRRSEYTGYIT